MEADPPHIEEVMDENESMDESKPIIQEVADAPRENTLNMAEEDKENYGEHTFHIDWHKLVSMRGASGDEKKLYSDKFEVATYYWRILAFIQDNRNNPCLALFLDAPEASFTPHHMNPKADFTLTLVSQRPDVKSFHKESTHVFCSSETDWGFTAFFAATEIDNKANGWLKDGFLEIKCSVKVILDFSKLDSRKKTGCVGLKNQGATCYMNSLLQYLFHVPFFRNAVYHMPTNENDEISKSLPLALQSLFFKLQYSKTAVSTKDLTASFGWGSHDAFQQHDVQELNRVLCEKLEEKMKGTKVDKVINQLYEGHTLNYIDCINVDFKSTRKESFMDLSLDVKGCKNVYESFLKYTEVEIMDGQDQYQSEKHGLQDARKGISFINLPPVLQLQLKRFEYDFQRDVNIKINDRYEFPEVLDLDFDGKRIFTQDSDPNISSRYRLHSVLVHSGSVHGGHYYAYITPDGEKWFKFDDEKVDPADKKEAIEDQFGGSDDSFNRAARISNAYMLVYIRASDWDRLMGCGGKEEISEGLRKRFEAEQRDKEARQKMKVEAHMYCTVKLAMDEDMKAQVGSESGGLFFELVDHDQLPSDKTIRLKKGIKFTEIKNRVQDLTGVPPSQQRIWAFSIKNDQSYRPSRVLTAEEEEKPLMDLKDLRDQRQGGFSRKLQSLMDFKFYVELPRQFPKEGGQVLAPQKSLLPYSPKTEILLFFKFYDPSKNTISFTGSLIVRKDQIISDLAKYCNRLSGLDANTPLDFYEEVRADPADIRPLDPRRIISGKGVNAEDVLTDGDIVIYQVASDGAEDTFRFPRVIQFLEWTRSRCLVTFKKLEETKEAGFKLELLREMEYDQVIASIATYLGLPDPSHLRLTQYSTFSNAPFRFPIKFGKNPNLENMLRNNKGICDILYYEQLDMPQEEYEKLRVITIHFHGDKTEWLGAFSIRVPREGSTVQTILAQLRTLIPPAFLSKDLRVMEVYNSCAFKILAEDQKTEDMNDSYWTYRAEPNPSDEVNLPEDERLITVCHIDLEKEDSIKHFGDPLFIRIKDAETVADVKARIRAKLAINVEEFEKWGIHLLVSGKATALRDGDVLGPLMPKDQNDTHLALEHDAPKGPARRREVKGMKKEEAIKINA